MLPIDQELREFVMETFLYGNGVLRNNDSFLEQGLIDSTGMLELVNFVQQKYGVKVADDELIPDNFDSIQKLSAFIQRKREGGGLRANISLESVLQEGAPKTQ